MTCLFYNKIKNKLLILVLCFTIVFSSLNYNKVYADGGVISLPMLAVVSSLAVGTGIVLNSSDNLYDIGSFFYNWVESKKDLDMATLNATFLACTSVVGNKINVKSDFLDIIKSFFDETFPNDVSFDSVGWIGGLPYYNFEYVYPLPSLLGYSYNLKGALDAVGKSVTVGDFNLSCEKRTYSSSFSSWYSSCRVTSDSFPGVNYNFLIYDTDKLEDIRFSVLNLNGSKCLAYSVRTTKNEIRSGHLSFSYEYSPSFPYTGGYSWDSVNNGKEEDNSVSLPIPQNLGNLVGQDKGSFWENTDGLVGGKPITKPGANNPSIDVDTSTDSFPSTDSDTPSIPNDSIWSTVKDFIVSLVVPSDSYWTDTWGSLYNNFTSSFPMVDVDGFNDLVTGEKKFPNIDINIMGVSGRVVNGDVINSIVDWLRPIIAGFMMLCLMLFNYRKIYKLIRNSDPFGGIAPGTSDFSTGISEYSKQDVIKVTDMSSEYKAWKERGVK